MAMDNQLWWQKGDNCAATTNSKEQSTNAWQLDEQQRYDEVEDIGS
jgi:hypothetical protein